MSTKDSSLKYVYCGTEISTTLLEPFRNSEPAVNDAAVIVEQLAKAHEDLKRREQQQRERRKRQQQERQQREQQRQELNPEQRKQQRRRHRQEEDEEDEEEQAEEAIATAFRTAKRPGLDGKPQHELIEGVSAFLLVILEEHRRGSLSTMNEIKQFVHDTQYFVRLYERLLELGSSDQSQLLEDDALEIGGCWARVNDAIDRYHVHSQIRNAVGLAELGVGNRTVKEVVLELVLPFTLSTSDAAPQLTWMADSPPWSSTGSFADLFVGWHAVAGKVALKRLRSDGNYDETLKYFERERDIWQPLQHSNVLQLLGTFIHESYCYFASPFMKNGSLSDYIRKNPSVDRPRLLQEIADGLVYLHKEKVVHGNINAGNILISNDLHAQICDFSLAKPSGKRTSRALKGAGNWRWLSPELLDGEPKTTASDVYAFGMTIVEVLTGDIPFPGLKTISGLIRVVQTEGKRPPKEPEFSPEGVPYANTWDVAEQCWPADPKQRISMSDAFIGLSTFMDPDPIPSSSSSNIEGKVSFDPSTPVNTSGHFCDLFVGSLETIGKVALKRLRCGTEDKDTEAKKRLFLSEADIWKGLQHDHILSCLGTFVRDGSQYIVSPFMSNGSLADYIRERPLVNRIQLLQQTASALVYLYEKGVVHGDIKSNNILVTDDIQAVLCDFGLTRLSESRTATMVHGAGTMQFQSPELWDGKPKTFESDVYAFGMTIVEVLTGDVPFPDLKSVTAFYKAVHERGERPPKKPETSPKGVSYARTWNVAEKCWCPDPKTRISILEAFKRLRHSTTILDFRINPSSASHDIGEDILFIDSTPSNTRGHFCDLYIGRHKEIGKVALKRLRGGKDEQDHEVIKQHFQSEAERWKGLQHDHILSFLGTFVRDGYLYLVSPFIANGTLRGHIERDPFVDRGRLLRETADALVYLHAKGVVHGDVRSNNILVTDDIHALLSDFGLKRLPKSSTTTTLKRIGTIRWQSPELWQDSPKTPESDVYAFAMTIVEVLSGSDPFPDITIDAAVATAVLRQGKRPDKVPKSSPGGTSYEHIWLVAERCWSTDPNERITMRDAFNELQDPAA